MKFLVKVIGSDELLMFIENVTKVSEGAVNGTLVVETEHDAYVLTVVNPNNYWVMGEEI